MANKAIFGNAVSSTRVTNKINSKAHFKEEVKSDIEEEAITNLFTKLRAFTQEDEGFIIKPGLLAPLALKSKKSVDSLINDTDTKILVDVKSKLIVDFNIKESGVTFASQSDESVFRAQCVFDKKILLHHYILFFENGDGAIVYFHFTFGDIPNRGCVSGGDYFIAGLKTFFLANSQRVSCPTVMDKDLFWSTIGHEKVMKDVTNELEITNTSNNTVLTNAEVTNLDELLLKVIKVVAKDASIKHDGLIINNLDGSPLDIENNTDITIKKSFSTLDKQAAVLNTIKNKLD